MRSVTACASSLSTFTTPESLLLPGHSAQTSFGTSTRPHLRRLSPVSRQGPSLRYLSEADLVDLVPPAVLIAQIERGLFDLLQQKVLLRPRDHLEFDDSTLLTMPVVGAVALGAKVVSVYPSNVSRGLPAISGLMTLFDRATGTPRAVMNAAALTAQRTGAVGAIGLKYTTPPDIERLGIVGTGGQGTWQAIFACAVRPIRTIFFEPLG